MTFCDSFYQKNRFLRNQGTLKITLFQCYEVLWIDNIDVICIFYCAVNVLLIAHLRILSLEIFPFTQIIVNKEKQDQMNLDL